MSQTHEPMSNGSHELISHENEWITWHSLHLGDAHKGESCVHSGRSPIPVLFQPDKT